MIDILTMSHICTIQQLENGIGRNATDFETLSKMEVSSLENLRDKLVKEYNQVVGGK